MRHRPETLGGSGCVALDGWEVLMGALLRLQVDFEIEFERGPFYSACASVARSIFFSSSIASTYCNDAARIGVAANAGVCNFPNKQCRPISVPIKPRAAAPPASAQWPPVAGPV